jgi:spermidine/putrescine transport system ATP-binding protein
MVELRSVSKRFGEFHAVRDVSLEIQAGEFLTLLGPSGCGKTTLLRMISGFETPTAGSVIIDGQDVTQLPPYRRNVNQVFQSYALFPHLTVEENIAFGLQMKRLPNAEISDKVRRAIELVSLQGKERNRPAELSGGQKQRVALARAIVCEPKVLLLDEPLSALDARLREQMQIELKQLQHRLGITFVFVTHDQQEALTMSDRIAVVNAGAIEQLGTAGEIYHHPRTRFVAEFIGQANLMDAAVVDRQSGGMVLKLAGDLTVRVNDSGVPASAQSVLISIRPERIHLSGAAEPDGGSFQATVVEEIFRGQTARLTLRTEGGQEFTAVVANESSTQKSFHKGDVVHASLHPGDIAVVRDS